MSAGSLGAVSMTLGRLELALGDVEAGVALLRSALDVHERLGMAPWAELTRGYLDAARQVATDA